MNPQLSWGKIREEKSGNGNPCNRSVPVGSQLSQRKMTHPTYTLYNEMSGRRGARFLKDRRIELSDRGGNKNGVFISCKNIISGTRRGRFEGRFSLAFQRRIRNCSTAKTREDIAKTKRKVENEG